jgi:CheY-like chemotaxis protein
VRSDAIRVVVGQFEPDCVLLDGEARDEYGESWNDAVWLGGRSRPVPVIMFSADLRATKEVQEATSERSRIAGFHAVISKPFDIDELIDTVAHAVGHAVPFDPSPAAEVLRTATLKAKLEAAGAQDIHVSTRREWGIFRTVDGTCCAALLVAARWGLLPHTSR